MNNNVVMASNFIKNIIEEYLKTGKHSNIITRFPPEPNGYLHVGHAKAICLNFGLAEMFNGKCNLRFDDTNPEKESEEYAQSIMESVKWLGFQWNDGIKYASDYFDKLYEFAEYFINQNLAYVCDLTSDEMREYRGDFATRGKNSIYRDRSIEENLSLFRAMREGKFIDGSKTLRLKIDMGSPNINLRDPVIYRIKRFHHIRTGNKWCIYPMYDYTHCISDALESITHSCCTLEFEDHRVLYDWVVEHLYHAGLVPSKPRQIEFSRLELHNTITSKRKLNELVTGKLVSAWDDPRMPTISGMRRRGYSKDGIRLFATRCGISKSPNIVDMSLLESSVREELENVAPRVMAVLNPLKVVLTNFDANTASRSSAFHPKMVELGERFVELTREIYIEQDDFMLEPIDGWQRLSIGGEVRLRHSYVVKCESVVRDDGGTVVELHCYIDKSTLGKNPEGRKVKGVIHWVSIEKALKAEVRLYDRLFTETEPDKVTDHDFKEIINKDSLVNITGYIEPAIINAKAEDSYQFERLGYFVADRFDHDATKGKYVFNRTVSLKDTWSK
ncbi:MAG: glutamine--tRNA ligase/YqeY domain fusion protein [Burkholderiales bacterium]|nr:glutamine--tRNA ligase/YqeY domain fusion protein [Burkholderiales bacterium]